MPIIKNYYIADLHLGHKNILKFSEGKRRGATVEEHDEWIISQWNSVVTPRDNVYLLGDVAFGDAALQKVKRLNGHKYLLPGNHDQGDVAKYKTLFVNIISARKHKGFWISHIPLHPNCLQNMFNIHGHVHQHDINDLRYINVSVEALRGIPLSLETIHSVIESRQIAMYQNTPQFRNEQARIEIEKTRTLNKKLQELGLAGNFEEAYKKYHGETDE